MASTLTAFTQASSSITPAFLYYETEEEKCGGGGGLCVNGKLIVNEGCIDFCNPPHNQRECFLINIQPTSSVTADMGWQTSVIAGGSPPSLVSQAYPHTTSTKNLHAAHKCVNFLSRRPSTSLHFHPHCLLIKIQLISEWPCAEM